MVERAPMTLKDLVPNLPLLPKASCKNYKFPDLFFPTGRAEEKKVLPLAQAICAGCPERKECLDYALQEQIPYGIWAGTTPAMRGITVKKEKSFLAKKRAEKIRNLSKLGRTSIEIARILNLSQGYVNVILKKNRSKLIGENQSQPIRKSGEESPSSSRCQR